MEKTLKIYQWLIGLLIMLNVGLVGSFWYFSGQKSMLPPREIGQFLIKEVGFTKEQADQYKNMIGEHQLATRKIREQIRDAKSELFHFSNPDPQKTQAILERIGQLHIKQDQLTYEHFSELRSLLQSEQQEIFDKIITDLLESQGAPGRGPMERPPRPLP